MQLGWWRGWLLVFSLVPQALRFGADSLEASTGSGEHPRSRYSWESVLDRMRQDRDRLSEHLKAAHATLLARAEKEDSALVARLSPEPPLPRPQGYGMLPVLKEGPTPRSGAPRKQVYSLEALGGRFTTNLEDAAALARRALEDADSPLEALVSEFEALRGKLRNLEDHIAYHASWQKAVVADSAYFADRNEILTRIEAWQALVRQGEDPARAAVMRREILERVSPFRATPGLAVRAAEDGTQVLAVRLVTDIEDADFLEAFRRAVSETFCGSPIAQVRRFRLDLSFEVLSAQTLYPEGAPDRGARLDEDDHLARFPGGSLVLTTGAHRTQARVGRAVLLGSETRSHSSLAHEFGHLLGFSDAYLRAYEGDPRDPYGCVLVEWSGLSEDLMGSPDSGCVTEEMVDALLKAYRGG